MKLLQALLFRFVSLSSVKLEFSIEQKDTLPQTTHIRSHLTFFDTFQDEHDLTINISNLKRDPFLITHKKYLFPFTNTYKKDLIVLAMVAPLLMAFEIT